MNSRSSKVLLLCLPLAAVVWFLWPHHQRPSAPISTAPTAANPVVTGAVQTAPKAPVVSSGSVSNSVAASAPKKNKFAYRLSNTTKSLHELAHSAHAILLDNALIDTTGKLDFTIPKQLKATGDPGAYIVQANGNINSTLR